MTKKDKELLLKDICARLPYGVKAKITEEGVLSYDSGIGVIVGKEYVDNETFILQCKNDSYFLTIISEFMPYLRPLSSMTEEEERELSKKYVWNINCGQIEIRYHCEGYWDDDTECPTKEYLNLFDWLNAHHFDYRGLIDMGLALPAPEGMYKEE